MIAEDIPPPLTQAELSAGSITVSDDNSAEQSLELLRLSNLASQHALRGRTQQSGSSGHSRASRLAKEKERERDKEKPRFIEFTMTHYQVTRFVQVCIAQVLPPELLGSQKNAKCLAACESSTLVTTGRLSPLSKQKFQSSSASCQPVDTKRFPCISSCRGSPSRIASG